jgi:putative DNA primase/helicase
VSRRDPDPLTAAERADNEWRETHHRNGTWGEEMAGLKAKSDPETNAAFDELLIGQEPPRDRDEASGSGDHWREPLTELGLARRVVAAYGERIRYVAEWKSWLVWDGTRWSRDTTGLVARFAKVTARGLTDRTMWIRDPSERKAKERETKRLESASAIRGALTLASTESEVAVAVEDLDSDPLLLNCANGVLDLRSGELSPHDPKQLITKSTGVAYNPVARGPVFTGFLERIQPDSEVRSGLGRLVGHSLEGKVTVHLLQIWQGSGGNGKSVLSSAITNALGDYAAAADPGLLLARQFDAHPTNVADLYGLRLAVLHESDHGRRLAEGTVKRLTGGDQLKARRMREDFWSFDPSHSLVMLTNHRPIITGRDEGIWRRIRLVPFEVTIPAGEEDDHLLDKIEPEAVLAWLVAGWFDYRDHGLAEPTRIRTATQEYREESDPVGRFIEERCMTLATATVRSSELYAAWGSWCGVDGIPPGTNRAFSIDLQNRGYDKEHSRAGELWHGIGLYAKESD